jgi:hypothetical protein
VGVRGRGTQLEKEEERGGGTLLEKKRIYKEDHTFIRKGYE